jgi:hypothetical protein
MYFPIFGNVEIGILRQWNKNRSTLILFQEKPMATALRSFRGFRNGMMVAVGAAWIAGAATAALAAPILLYQMNDSGNSTASSGSNAAPLNFYDSSTPTNLHGSAGSGVSGAAADLAMDQSGVNGMGNKSTSNTIYATTHTSVSAINTLSSFTLAGWFKTSEAGESLDRYAFLFDNRIGASAANGFELFGNAGDLTLIVNGTGVTSAGGAYDQANKWIFFAATYDGTATTDNVKFYRGYRNAAEAGANPPFSMIGTATLNEGTESNPGAALFIGNADSKVRPFRGFLDEMSVYGAASGNGGALSSTALNQIRAGAVPEPGTGMVGLLGALALCRRRR